MNYDEMRGKQGANMFIHVAPLVGHDQFYFFSHYSSTMAIVFLGIVAMLRDQFLAIAPQGLSAVFFFSSLS